MNLIKNPDSAFDGLENVSIQNRIDISSLLGYVGYSNNFHTYFINLFTNVFKYSRESVHIFKSIPEKMLKFYNRGYDRYSNLELAYYKMMEGGNIDQ